MHFGHYISGSAHAGILSWLLLGSWFAPPEPVPIESVSVAMISSAEFAAMTMSDESPQATQLTIEVLSPSEQEKLDLLMPSQIKSIAQVVEIDMVSNAEAQEVKPQTPNPSGLPSPSLAEDMPSLNKPSQNDFALLRAPEVIDAPRKAKRISTLATAPPPPEMKVDDKLLDEALPPGIAAPSPVEDPPIVQDITSAAQKETSVEITPELSKEIPSAPKVSLNPQSTKEVLQNIEPPAEFIEEPQELPQTSAPQTSLRPKTRPQREEPARFKEVEKAETSTALSDQVNSVVSRALTEVVRSSLTEGQKGEIRSTVQNAIRPYWHVLPGSPASNVVIVVRLEFDRTGTVKEDSIELISSVGENEKAVRTAFRKAKTAIKRASLQRAFKLPVETFDGWKVLDLEFDPEKMRKR